MKLLPALILFPALTIGTLAPAAAQYGRSLYSVTVPGQRFYDHSHSFSSAADCTFISAPLAFENRFGDRYSRPAPGATMGLSAADYGMPGYSLFDFDPTNPDRRPELEDPASAAAYPTQRSYPGGGLGGFNWDTRCGYAARFEAADRARIARRDRTWSLAMEAMAQGDNARAVELFQKGYSKIGAPAYAYTAGVMLYHGQGVKRDPARAIALFDDVALARGTQHMRVRFDPARPEQVNSSVQAMLALADIYLSGKDVPADRKFAGKLLQRAVDTGYRPANLKLARVLTTGPEQQRDYPRAVVLLEEAAKSAHAPSQYALAQLYERGLGVPPDAAKSFEWYRQAAFNLYDPSHKPQSQYQLARMLDSGTGAARDPAKALALYRLAALAGHPDALAALADYLYRGEQVDKNPVKARELYRAAAERGNADAMSNLAALLVRGEGGEADPAQAYGWLLVADRAGHPDAGSRARLMQASLSAEQRAKVESTLLPVLTR